MCFFNPNLIFAIILLNSIYSFAQNEPYNDLFSFEMISNTDILQNKKNIKALSVNFENQETSNFCASLKNNPQLLEVQLQNPTQEAINSLSEILGQSLTHLLIRSYRENTLKTPPFAQLELLSITSGYIISLDMIDANLDKL